MSCNSAAWKRPLDAALLAALATEFDALAGTALAELRVQHGDPARAALERRVHLKVAGADTSLAVAWEPGATLLGLRRGFDELHARHFGFRADAEAVLVAESLELEAVVASSSESAEPAPLPRATGAPAKVGTRRVWCADGWHDAPVYRRDALLAGATVRGPALIVEPHATTVVEPGWRATVHATGTLVLTRARRRNPREAVAAEADPIMLEVFNNLFMHVAEEMGIVLEHTAHSVNIKERLDFSCALFVGRRRPDRERAAHPRAPGLDGRQRAEHPAPAPAGARGFVPVK